MFDSSPLQNEEWVLRSCFRLDFVYVRKKYNISRATLAKLSGVSEQTILKLEQGENKNPRLNTVRRLELALRNLHDMREKIDQEMAPFEA